MRIAQQKFQENIAEYMLYMFQVEDLIRAYQLDLELIMENVVYPQIQDPALIDQYRNWYKGIITEMKNRKLEKKGHVAAISEVSLELYYLHNTLLNITKDAKYIAACDRALPYLEEFRGKSDLKDKNSVDISLHALYMKLLLRLKNKEITEQTEEAFDAMRMMLAYLSKAYHKMKSGDLDFLKN